MPGTLCQERKGLQPKAVSDRLVSPNGFAVGLSCLELLLLLWGAEARGGCTSQGWEEKQSHQAVMRGGGVSLDKACLYCSTTTTKVKKPSLLPQCWSAGFYSEGCNSLIFNQRWGGSKIAVEVSRFFYLFYCNNETQCENHELSLSMYQHVIELNQSTYGKYYKSAIMLWYNRVI